MKRICFSASDRCDVVSLLTRLFGGGVCGTRGNGLSSFPFKEELAIVQYTESVYVSAPSDSASTPKVSSPEVTSFLGSSHVVTKRSGGGGE